MGRLPPSPPPKGKGSPSLHDIARSLEYEPELTLYVSDDAYNRVIEYAEFVPHRFLPDALEGFDETFIGSVFGISIYKDGELGEGIAEFRYRDGAHTFTLSNLPPIDISFRSTHK